MTHGDPKQGGEPVRMSPWNVGWLQTQCDVKADITSAAQLHKVLQVRENTQLLCINMSVLSCCSIL